MSSEEEAEEPQLAGGEEAVEEVDRHRRRSASGRLPLNGLEALLRNNPAFTLSEQRWLRDLTRQANTYSRLGDSLNAALQPFKAMLEPSKAAMDLDNHLSKLNILPPTPRSLRFSITPTAVQQLTDSLNTALSSETFRARLSKLNVSSPRYLRFVINANALQQFADSIERLIRLPAINFPHD